MLSDWLAERLPLLSVRRGGLERRPRHADGPRSRVHPPHLNPAQYLEEPLSLLAAKQIARGHAEIVHR